MDGQVAMPLEFAEGFRGELLRPADEGYEEARGLFNGMIDKHPALIARCADVADVMGSCDGGLVVDLSAMRGTRVDPGARTVRAEGGCKWGDVDHASTASG